MVKVEIACVYVKYYPQSTRSLSKQVQTNEQLSTLVSTLDDVSGVQQVQTSGFHF